LFICKSYHDEQKLYKSYTGYRADFLKQLKSQWKIKLDFCRGNKGDANFLPTVCYFVA